VAAEALTNVAKHACADATQVRVQRDDGWAEITVTDDAVGGAGAAAGSGLRGLADRIDALGGRISVESAAGGGPRCGRACPSREAAAGRLQRRVTGVSRDGMAVELRDVADGLWLWRQPHPDWSEGNDWEPEVASFAVVSGGVPILLDPLAPPPGARDVWERIDAFAPRAAIVLKPDHVRDVDLFVRWYGVDAYGPFLFWAADVPRTELRPVRPGDELPGGLQALHDGRGAMETPVYLPEQRALVFADAMTAPGGVLHVWHTPWHEERTVPALRALLDLPFERVLVSHGEPVHTRADFEAALRREPWSISTGA
jgi:hypothetical protein